MLQMYYCPKCKKMRMVSNHSNLKNRDICPACDTRHILADTTYEEWITFGQYERDQCIKAYARAYPYREDKDSCDK